MKIFIFLLYSLHPHWCIRNWRMYRLNNSKKKICRVNFFFISQLKHFLRFFFLNNKKKICSNVKIIIIFRNVATATTTTVGNYNGRTTRTRWRRLIIAKSKILVSKMQKSFLSKLFNVQTLQIRVPWFNATLSMPLLLSH